MKHFVLFLFILVSVNFAFADSAITIHPYPGIEIYVYNSEQKHVAVHGMFHVENFDPGTILYTDKIVGTEPLNVKYTSTQIENVYEQNRSITCMAFSRTEHKFLGYPHVFLLKDNTSFMITLERHDDGHYRFISKF